MGWSILGGMGGAVNMAPWRPGKTRQTETYVWSGETNGGAGKAKGGSWMTEVSESKQPLAAGALVSLKMGLSTEHPAKLTIDACEQEGKE